MDAGNARALMVAATWQRIAPLFFLHNARVKVYHNDIRHSMDDSQRNDVELHMDMPGISKTSGAFAEADVHLFHQHGTFVKGEYSRTQTLAEMIMYPSEGPSMYMQTAPRSLRHNAGIFLRQRLRLDDRQKITLSFRGDLANDILQPGTGKDQWEVFKPEMPSASSAFAKTFSVLYNWKVAPKIRLDLQSGYGERMPSITERFGFYLFNRFDGFDYMGNPDLKNEGAWSAEATVNYFGTRIEVQVTPFVHRISHFAMGESIEVVPMTIGARGVKQYRNLDWANLSGFDLMLLARPIPALQLISATKYTCGKTAKGDPLPMVPPLKILTSLRFDRGKINIQVEWELSSAQRRVNPDSMEETTPGWSVLAVRTGWKISSFLQCNAGVENLLNKTYHEHLNWGGIPRPGRNLYFNVQYKF